uniref:FMRFamide-gated Na+ channel n=1 Tax=Aplysia californica TaxID=6500 RepID=UPI0027293F1E|nr:Chain A, FMRFamide-gated Na+ channel [Aplysia californica]7YVB_B Chain B, FMRFamide-gated Na+ channel [Aplysia californica]7YVB_C Chain C, FMRFamide-gated Na+ channel [Aplysia californica]7YVC_A Chain A, FMRFamide-gated Na+ channel [Aplysia californica]7YVC_B Chain B, FMRFamide-gated Na+ channel [Aplysia californica]7YVC_C Chain C, FMRFamide-gated Na+ channel [Aplysia californica]
MLGRGERIKPYHFRDSSADHMKYTSVSAKSGMVPEHRYTMVRSRHHGRHHHHHSYQEYNTQRSAISLIAELGSESNAHGLAKIVTSRDTKRKVIWALMVIIGFTAATLQLSLLVRKYLQFQVVELSEIKDSMPVEYPSVTICNIEPISLRKIRKAYNKNESQNLKDWLNFTQTFHFKDMSFMNSIRAFYENLGSDAKKISHDLRDLLIHCRFNREECTTENFTSSFDGNYFNCFTFNGGQLRDQLQMHATGPENGLSLIISIEKDEPLPGTYGVYNFENNILHSAGVRVVVHAPGSMPSPVDHGFDIPPGYSSSVGLKALLHTRLSEPYGNCTEDSLEGIQTYRNTFFACLQLCKQRRLIRECKCKSSALPDLSVENITFCGVIPDWKDIRRNVTGEYKMNQTIPTISLACEARVQKQLNNDRSYETECGCYQPCSETSYLKSVSLSYWPLEFYQLSALERFFSQKNPTDQQHFMKIAQDFLSRLAHPQQQALARNNSHDKDILTTSYSLSEKEMAKEASDLIRQNLLRLNIYLEDLSVVEYRQLPAYGLADLFADIGGTLGLWMGISVLTIMELMELIIRLFALIFNAEREVPKAPVHSSNNGGGGGGDGQHNFANGDVEHERDTHFPDLGSSDFDFRRGGGIGAESPVNVEGGSSGGLVPRGSGGSSGGHHHHHHHH